LVNYLISSCYIWFAYFRPNLKIFTSTTIRSLILEKWNGFVTLNTQLWVKINFNKFHISDRSKLCTGLRWGKFILQKESLLYHRDLFMEWTEEKSIYHIINVTLGDGLVHEHILHTKFVMWYCYEQVLRVFPVWFFRGMLLFL